MFAETQTKREKSSGMRKTDFHVYVCLNKFCCSAYYALCCIYINNNNICIIIVSLIILHVVCMLIWCAYNSAERCTLLI